MFQYISTWKLGKSLLNVHAKEKVLCMLPDVQQSRLTRKGM